MADNVPWLPVPGMHRRVNAWVTNATQFQVVSHIEWLQEEIECFHHWLDVQGAPRDDGKGNSYSLVGRVTLLMRFRSATP